MLDHMDDWAEEPWLWHLLHHANGRSAPTSWRCAKRGDSLDLRWIGSNGFGGGWSHLLSNKGESKAKKGHLPFFCQFFAFFRDGTGTQSLKLCLSHESSFIWTVLPDQPQRLLPATKILPLQLLIKGQNPAVAGCFFKRGVKHPTMD